ncbi:hypothetical protein D1BOALGB6SA_2701 [Olavius sp. associated proteobacterium Delta 1]|nr:hypothetical protein D1BOALGB6SA_2701 [Olavius sp. associated proteobacterium Delta 1]
MKIDRYLLVVSFLFLFVSGLVTVAKAEESKIANLSFPSGEYIFYPQENKPFKIIFHRDGKWETVDKGIGLWLYYDNSKFYMYLANWKNKNFDAKRTKLLLEGNLKIDNKKLILSGFIDGQPRISEFVRVSKDKTQRSPMAPDGSAVITVEEEDRRVEPPSATEGQRSGIKKPLN